jgi:hypothetical protein
MKMQQKQVRVDVKLKRESLLLPSVCGLEAKETILNDPVIIRQNSLRSLSVSSQSIAFHEKTLFFFKNTVNNNYHNLHY